MEEVTVYKINNTINEECYVGSTLNYKARKLSHLSELRRGVHHCIKLQEIFELVGENGISFEVLVIVNEQNRAIEEERYINKFGTLNTYKKVYDVSGVSTPVKVYDSKIKLIGKYSSRKKASKELNLNIKTLPCKSNGVFIFEMGHSYKEIENFICTYKDNRDQKTVVYQFNLKGEFIKKWEDLREASEHFSGKRFTNNIRQAIKRKGTAYNSYWSLVKKFDVPIKTIDPRSINIEVIRKGKTTEYKSIREAAREGKESISTIKRSIRSGKPTRYGVIYIKSKKS